MCAIISVQEVKELTSSDMQVLTLMLEKHFADTNAQISEMRRDNAEFREQIRQDMRDLEDRVNARIDALDAKFTTKIDALDEKFTKKTEALDTKFTAQFDAVHAEIAHMQSDITGLKHDVAGLYNWDYWLLTIIIAVIAMPQIVEGLKSLFMAIAEGLGVIVSAFRKEGRQK